ncbi:MAG: mRNA-decapping enzyme subunit 2 [Chaenotheca gracillima]|nr:MAG: mRNA-decapping enzyme subunit 2 [Chaenotheca gracillima]
MAGVVTKFVGRRILKESADNHFGQEDPYFEQVPVLKRDGTPSGKTKKQRRAVAACVSPHDAKILRKVERRAYRLDRCLFNCCGLKFGWSSVIGIIPWIGDVIDLWLALKVIKTSLEVEDTLPSALVNRMRLHIAIDFIVRLVPFLGDFADVFYRCNTRNAGILRKHLERHQENPVDKKHAKAARQRTDRSPDPRRKDRGGPPLPRYEDVAGHRPRHETSTRDPRTHRTQQQRPQQQTNGRGWFGQGGASREQARDLEMGSDPPVQPPRRVSPGRV